MTDEIENVDSVEEEIKEESIGKIRRRLDRICPDCEEGNLYIVVYDIENEGVIYSREFYQCFECEYKEEKKNKNNNHKEINLDDIYR